MSIQSEISRLEKAKTDMAAAITDKGVEVPPSTLLDGFAALIAQIQGGGGGTGLKKVYLGELETMLDESYALCIYGSVTPESGNITAADIIGMLAECDDPTYGPWHAVRIENSDIGMKDYGWVFEQYIWDSELGTQLQGGGSFEISDDSPGSLSIAWTLDNAATYVPTSKTVKLYGFVRDDSGGGGDFEITDASYLFSHGVRIEQMDEYIRRIKPGASLSSLFFYDTTGKVRIYDLSIYPSLALSSDWSYAFHQVGGHTVTIKLPNFRPDIEYIFDELFSYINQGSSFNLRQNFDFSCFSGCQIASAKNMFQHLIGWTSVDLSMVETYKGDSIPVYDSMFAGCSKLYDVNISSLLNCKCSISGIFNGCSSLSGVLDFSAYPDFIATTFYNAFNGCTKLEGVLDFPAFYASGNYTIFPHGTKGSPVALKRLTFRTNLPAGFTKTTTSTHNLSYCSFERSGVLEMFGTLSDVSDISRAMTITLTGNPCVTDGSLADEDIAIATEKGWTVVTA